MQKAPCCRLVIPGSWGRFLHRTARLDETRRRVRAHGRHAGGAMRILRMLALAIVAATCAGAAVAQYPERPVTMIVPFPPGGVADTVARPVAEALGAALKQPVVIENRAGAGGAIGMAHVAKSKPDGYTVLLALSSLVVLPEAD